MAINITKNVFSVRQFRHGAIAPNATLRHFRVCVYEFNLRRRANDGTEIFATILGIMPTAKAATLTVVQTHL